jgi:hypothetical protein
VKFSCGYVHTKFRFPIVQCFCLLIIVCLFHRYIDKHSYKQGLVYFYSIRLNVFFQFNALLLSNSILSSSAALRFNNQQVSGDFDSYKLL